MDTSFAAGNSVIGYLYQLRYALDLMFAADEGARMSIESLDDIDIQNINSKIELYQLKHHTKPASLSDTSKDLWKTLRIWSYYIQKGKVSAPDTKLILITTAIAPEDSIASTLKNKDIQKAKNQLEKIATSSNDDSLVGSFSAYLSLSDVQQEYLLDSIFIADGSSNIMEISKDTKKKLLLLADEKYTDKVYERIEGWWVDQIISHLKGESQYPISQTQLFKKAREIATQFHEDSLPIDFLDTEPPDTLETEGNDLLFIEQLKMIVTKNERIRIAIRDYYRAFEQRSKWIREELLLTDEIEIYERTLIEEWKRMRLAKEELLSSNPSEEECRTLGFNIFDEVDRKFKFNIRPNVTEPYVMRGSYHILANQYPQPRVWWHPKFLEKLQNILQNATDINKIDNA